MKICHVVSTYPRNEEDPEVPWLAELVSRMQKQGVDVSVFAPAYQGLKNHQIRGVSVYRFRYFFRRWEKLTHESGAPNKIRNPLYKSMALFYLFFGALQFHKLCRKEKFEIVHVHWPFPHALLAFWGAKRVKAKLVLSFYTAELKIAARRRYAAWLLKWAIKKAWKVIAISSAVKNELQRYGEKKPVVIPYGSTLEERSQNSPQPPQKTKEILFVGRLIERKGVEYLILAMPQILAQVPAVLFIVGDGAQRARLERLVVEQSLTKQVFFLGKLPKEQLSQRFQSCDVFVLPSVLDSKGDTEGLGVVLLEALTYKKPVVASNVGGIPDVIIHEKTGLLVEPEDIHALSQAIVKVLTDETFALKLGFNGYRHVKENFHWDGILRRFMALYEA